MLSRVSRGGSAGERAFTTKKTLRERVDEATIASRKRFPPAYGVFLGREGAAAHISFVILHSYNFRRPRVRVCKRLLVRVYPAPGAYRTLRRGPSGSPHKEAAPSATLAGDSFSTLDRCYTRVEERGDGTARGLIP